MCPWGKGRPSTCITGIMGVMGISLFFCLFFSESENILRIDLRGNVNRAIFWGAPEHANESVTGAGMAGDASLGHRTFTSPKTGFFFDATKLVSSNSRSRRWQASTPHPGIWVRRPVASAVVLVQAIA